MHKLQQKILDLAATENVGSYGYRKLAEKIGISHPQTAKYHLQKLIKDGKLRFDHAEGYTINDSDSSGGLLKMPLLGYANCGQPMMYTDSTRTDEYLTVSPSLLQGRNSDKLFVVQARGDSMNSARTKSGPINDNDYVIIDATKRSPDNGDYILASVDGLATIKKFKVDQQRKMIALCPESTAKHMPIYIHQDDAETFTCHGVVSAVIPAM